MALRQTRKSASVGNGMSGPDAVLVRDADVCEDADEELSDIADGEAVVVASSDSELIVVVWPSMTVTSGEAVVEEVSSETEADEEDVSVVAAGAAATELPVTETEAVVAACD